MSIKKNENIEQTGIPLYLDRKERSLADPIDGKIKKYDWHPANPPAIKLWRCLESLRDILNLLEGTSELKSNKDKHRRLKILATPLYSLCISIHNFYNYLETSPDNKSKFTSKERKRIVDINKGFCSHVPFGNAMQLRTVRDKISAHIDEKLIPQKAKKIFEKARIFKYGHWIHNSIIAVIELTNFDIYAWCAEDCPQGYMKLMSCEPKVVTFKMENNKPVAIVMVEVSISPRFDVKNICEELIQKTQWMFRPNEPRIMTLISHEMDNEK